MHARFIPGIAIAVGVLVAMPGSAGAQTAAAKTPAAAPAKAGTFKTPWGDPDLQGAWTNSTTTPLQRPAKWAGREFLTAQEIADANKDTDVGTDKRPERGTDADVAGAYNQFWWD